MNHQTTLHCGYHDNFSFIFIKLVYLLHLFSLKGYFKTCIELANKLVE